ncbi:SigE family RNA polymerase sigma factor [Propionicimonas sp.]|uniref:SigE family RNA polymerase sigma factor n=1 Tax=Propionicimonas sp. TaxID=1955623 RepID=UPI0039E40FDB
MTIWQGVLVSESTATAAGTAVSFDEYVTTRSAALQRFAFLITRNRDDALDAVQEALAGLYPRWARVSASGEVDAYVRRSIVNAHVSAWRKVRRLYPSEDPTLSASAPVVPDTADAVADADQALRLCGELPPVQRAAVVLRFYEDRSFAEIGRILGCPETTARSHVHRALVALRARLGGDHG